MEPITDLSMLFFKKIGVVFAGGPAPGGHNVISGIFDRVKEIHPESKVFGFIDGPSGLLKSNYVEITNDLVDSYRNQGGFDMLGLILNRIWKRQKRNYRIVNAVNEKLRVTRLRWPCRYRWRRN